MPLAAAGSPPWRQINQHQGGRSISSLAAGRSRTNVELAFRGLRHLADRLSDDFVAGIVMYTGQQTLPFGPKLRAMPVAALWEVAHPE